MSQKLTSHFVVGRYHELYDVVDLFVVLEIGSSASHNPEFIREHRPRLKFDPHLFDKRFRNKTLHVKLDGSLVHSSEPVKNLRMMLTHGFASAYRRARGWRGHTVGKDGISNDLVLLLLPPSDDVCIRWSCILVGLANDFEVARAAGAQRPRTPS